MRHPAITTGEGASGYRWQKNSYVGLARALTAVDSTTAYTVTDQTLRILS